MGDGVPDWKWGGWVLGDMADVLRRACDALGRPVDIVRVVVTPPTSTEELPRVEVEVPSERGLFRLRSEIGDGEYPVRFVGRATDRSWSAEVLGLRLVVAVDGGEL